MGISRPQPTQDPLQRTGSAAYVGQAQAPPGAQAGYTTSPPPMNQSSQWAPPQQNIAQAPQGWIQQQPQQPQGGYNPGSYPPMPGAAASGHQQAPPQGPPPFNQPLYNNPPQQPQHHQPGVHPQQPPPIPSLPPGYQAEVQHSTQGWQSQGQYSNQPAQHTYDQAQGQQSPVAQHGQQSYHPPPPNRSSTFITPGTQYPQGGSYFSAIDGNGSAPQADGNTPGTYGPPLPPPKDPHYESGHGMQQQLQGQNGPGYVSSGLAGQPNGPPPQQMYAYSQGQQQHPPSQGQYQYANQPHQSQQHNNPGVQQYQQAPLTQSPQSSFVQPAPVHPQTYGQPGHQHTPSQPLNQFQHPPAYPPTSTPPANAPHPPPAQQWETQPHQYQQQQQQPPYQQYQQHQVHQQQHGHSASVSQAGPPAAAFNPHIRQEEPVSPIQHGRQSISFENSKASVHSIPSRAGSNHIPSRNSSSVSRKQVNASTVGVSSPPRPEKKAPSPLFETTTSDAPRKVMDPNGIGSTGASALGMGGPSDWENFGAGEDEIDDLELYSQKRDSAIPEKKEEVAPVELPAGSPVESRVAVPWKAGAVEVEGSSPAAHHSPQSEQATVVGAVVEGGIITSVQPEQVLPAGHIRTQSAQQPGGPPPGHTQVLPPSSNSFVIDDGSGWTPPSQVQHQPNQLPVNPLHAIPQTVPFQAPRIQSAPPQSSAIVVGGGWTPGPPPTAVNAGPQQIVPQQQYSTAQHAVTGAAPFVAVAGQQGGQPPAAVDQRDLSGSQAEIQSLHARLAQTESELDQFKEMAVQQRLMNGQGTEEVQALKEKIARLQTESESAQAEVQNLQKSLEHAEMVGVTASNQHSAFEEEKAGLLAKIASAETSLASTKSESDATKTHLLGKVMAAESALAAFRAETESAHSGLQTKLTAAETALSTAKTEIDVLKKQLDDEKAKPTDVAPGLDPWFKGSLERFRDVLYSEASAVQMQDKMKLFQDFVNAESRLRGIELPYGANGEVKGFAPPVVPQPPTPQQAAVTSSQAKPTTPEEKLKSKPRLNSPISSDFVMVEPEQYSPGGRPIFYKPGQARAVSGETTSSEPEKNASTPSPAPIVSENEPGSAAFQPYKPFRRDSAPVIGQQQQQSRVEKRKAVPAVTQPSIDTNQPIYQPMKYNPNAGGTEKGATSPSADPVYTPIYQRAAFSAPQLPTQTRPATVKPEETFLPDIVETAQAKGVNMPVEAIIPAPLKPKTPAPQQTTQAQQAQTSTKAVTPSNAQSNLSPLEHLLDILPPIRMPNPSSSHPRLQPLYTSLNAFTTADLSFITTLTSKWEISVKETRRRLENERHKRQSETEQDPTQLFQAGEIGYDEIGKLEDEQRLREIEEMKKEADQEWQTYLNDVFDPVFARLQGEIAQLYKITQEIEVMLPASVAGDRALFAASASGSGAEVDVALADVLTLLLRVHSLTASREQAVGSCVAERDRRYKKNVTRTLYLTGEVSEMKRVEAGLERAEKKAEVQRREERLDRSKSVWKVVKAGVRKGVDENERFADALLDAVERVGGGGGDANAGVGGADGKAKDTAEALGRSKAILADLAASSTSLMRLFEQADNLLNDAEFEVMLAQEKADGATPEVFKDLEKQKAEQDAVLREDAVKRETGVDMALKDWELIVEKVTEEFAASKNVDPVDGGEEVDKDRRLKAALEAAKRRNGEA